MTGCDDRCAMPLPRMIGRTGLAAAAAAAVGGVSAYASRRRARGGERLQTPTRTPPPPLSTQSSPGQIADLQQAYGADMAPPEMDGAARR